MVSQFPIMLTLGWIYFPREQKAKRDLHRHKFASDRNSAQCSFSNRGNLLTPVMGKVRSKSRFRCGWFQMLRQSCQGASSSILPLRSAFLLIQPFFSSRQRWPLVIQAQSSSGHWQSWRKRDAPLMVTAQVPGKIPSGSAWVTCPSLNQSF